VIPHVPIKPYLDRSHQFDDETVRAMGVAFEMTRAALKYTAIDCPPETVAAMVIEIAKAGERDPDRMCESTLRNIR
jgi:hypothetical protein